MAPAPDTNLERRCSSGRSSVAAEMTETASPITATMSNASSALASPRSPTTAAQDNRTSVISQKSTSSALASPTNPVIAAAGRDASTVRASPAKVRGGVPADVIRLDALLVGGQRRFFDVKPDENAKVVKQRIWDQWPEDWPTRPAAFSALRLLHLGHFVEDPTTLGQRGLRKGAVTVIHVLIRADPQQSAGGDGDDASLKKGSQAQRRRAARSASRTGVGAGEESVGGGCRCVIC